MNKRLFGSTLMVAGTTIGAGMLAMPLACASIGFMTTLLLLIALWIVTSYTALLWVEVHQYSPPNTGMSTLATHYLGRSGYWITNVTLLLLLYALTAAYLTGGGTQLAARSMQSLGWPMDAKVGIICFSLIINGVVSIGTHSVDRLNRCLFGLKIAVLLFMLVLMAPHIQSINLLAMPLQKGLLLSSIPLLFTAFGFHGSIPSVVHYMEGQTQALRKIFLIGSAIPLVTYLGWQLAMHGLLSQPQFMTILADTPSVKGLMDTVGHVVGDHGINVAIGLFADLALTTSLLGVSLGLFDHLAELFTFKATVGGRFKTGIATFLPPLAFALFYPRGFLLALGYAAIALAILALLLPVALVYRTRKQHQDANRYRVKGGTAALILVTLCGAAIIIIQLANVMGWLDKLPL